MFLARRSFPMMRFDNFRNEMERLFKDFQTGWGDRSQLAEPSYPALSIWDNGESLCAEAEVPGFQMKDIEVTVMNNQLTLKGRRSVEHDENTAFHRRERFTGEFVRTMMLPVEVNPDKVEATLKDGVLTIQMPKTQAALARKIAVKQA